MAISNSFFGLRRGSTKTMTYSILNGVQITKDRVVGGENPRTDGQQSQRALFANAVKFYKHSQKALFKFAYEDKRSNESDYNAFMRHNISRSIILNNESVNDANFPAFGNGWLLSVGSLKPADLKYVQGADRFHLNYFAFSAPSATSNMSTVAELSQVLVADYNLQDGDVITSVYVTSGYRPNLLGPVANPPEWMIYQMRVDVSDDSPLEHFAIGDGIVIMSMLYPFTDGIVGASVIFSRPIKGEPLRVSTAELVNSKGANDVIAGTYTAAYRANALTSWGAAEKAILQGSLLDDAEVDPYPVNVVSVNGSLQVPAAMAIIPGQSASVTISFDRTYTAVVSDFTASIDNVGLELGAGGVLNIEVDASIPDGTVFAVMFKGAAIINITVGAAVLTVDGETSPLEGVQMQPGSDRAFVLTTAGVATLEADDFTTSSQNVTVALTAAKTITVTVQEDATVGAQFNVMFRDQIIISGEVAANPTVVSVNGDSSLPIEESVGVGAQYAATLELEFDTPYEPIVSDFSAVVKSSGEPQNLMSFAISGNTLTVSISATINTTRVMFRDQQIAEMYSPG